MWASVRVFWKGGKKDDVILQKKCLDEIRPKIDPLFAKRKEAYQEYSRLSDKVKASDCKHYGW